LPVLNRVWSGIALVTKGLPIVLTGGWGGIPVVTIGLPVLIWVLGGISVVNYGLPIIGSPSLARRLSVAGCTVIAGRLLGVTFFPEVARKRLSTNGPLVPRLLIAIRDSLVIVS
jgi:hypothetical protein